MGFRSTFVTDDLGIEWPTWFVDKWKDWVHCSWISIKEMVPLESGMYIVTFDRWPEVIAPYVLGKGFILDNTEAIGLEDKITYWMPVPPYPGRQR